LPRQVRVFFCKFTTKVSIVEFFTYLFFSFSLIFINFAA